MKRRFWIVPAAAVLCAAIINSCLIINAHIPSASMEPSINSGDFVIGNRNAYRNGDPRQGDIVFFKDEEISSSLIIKRIIATPGQRFSMVHGRVFINGALLEEPYIDSFSDDDYEEITVPEDSYIVLGDNRLNSSDSRVWDDPFITKDQIKAKASLIWFPEFKKIYME